MSIISLLTLVLYALMVCLMVRAVFSWIEPYPRNAVHRLAFQLTEPFLAPVRRLVPPMGGLDISFMLVFFGLMIVLQLVQRAG